jgi:hypothetical protein
MATLATVPSSLGLGYRTVSLAKRRAFSWGRAQGGLRPLLAAAESSERECLIITRERTWIAEIR